jgi:hypothetical protein
MNDQANSLDRLHDVALPPDVPWWPPAPGWYVVIGLLLIGAAMLFLRKRASHRANAYRRAALRQLELARDVAAIAELLRRTALAIAPRHEIVEKTGAAWVDWLASHCSELPSEAVRQQLTTGVYGRDVESCDINALREYAATWISNHRRTVIREEIR